MRAEHLRELVRRQPFEAFRVYTTDGKSYEIHHPDQVIVLRSRFVIGVGGSNGVAEHLEHIALAHVVRVEEIPSGATPDP
ncbi:MAG: hypothetical protein KY475_18965 [Planctomycetes bacterium]|nr:hypothetical protein [Planctomycetota bacterium]